MKVYFNYAAYQCYDSQKEAINCAYRYGRFDQTIAFGVQDIDEDFYYANQDIFSITKGAGYWTWKYYLACKLLATQEDQFILTHPDNSFKCSVHPLKNPYPEGTYFLYGDADIFFIQNVESFIKTLGQDSLMFFRAWSKLDSLCKPETLIETGIYDSPVCKTGTRGAGIFLFKKDNTARKFFRDLLPDMFNLGLIDTTMKEEYETKKPSYFLRHTQDTSILSIHAIKSGCYPYRWPGLTKIEYDILHNQLITKGRKTYYGYQYPESFTRDFYPPLILGKSAYDKVVEVTNRHD